jgi:protein-tyrosine phosphatase
MAGAVLRRLVDEAGLGDDVVIDTAGTGDWHVGNPMDERAEHALAARGYATDHIARQLQPIDLDRYDLVIGLDADNVADLRAMAPTPADRAKVHALLDYAPGQPPGAAVPDPYYGGSNDFDHALDLIEEGCQGLLDELRSTLLPR